MVKYDTYQYNIPHGPHGKEADTIDSAQSTVLVTIRFRCSITIPMAYEISAKITILVPITKIVFI